VLLHATKRRMLFQPAPARYPSAWAILGDQASSYAQVEAGTLAVAGALLSMGAPSGDRICILKECLSQFVPAYSGILRAGAMVVSPSIQ
jgi:long-chain acyl-CoA synthetase